MSFVVDNCEAEALDPRWITSKDSGMETAYWMGLCPDLEPFGWNCMPDRKREDENMADSFRPEDKKISKRMVSLHTISNS